MVAERKWARRARENAKSSPPVRDNICAENGRPKTIGLRGWISLGFRKRRPGRVRITSCKVADQIQRPGHQKIIIDVLGDPILKNSPAMGCRAEVGTASARTRKRPRENANSSPPVRDNICDRKRAPKKQWPARLDFTWCLEATARAGENHFVQCDLSKSTARPSENYNRRTRRPDFGKSAGDWLPSASGHGDRAKTQAAARKRKIEFPSS